jgi:hypothetical protein
MYSKITDKQLVGWKNALAKSNIIYDTDDDYREAMHNLVGFFDVLIQIDLEQKRKAGQDGTQVSGST